MLLSQGTFIANMNSIQLKAKELQNKMYFPIMLTSPDSLTYKIAKCSIVWYPNFAPKYLQLVGSSRFLLGSVQLLF